MTELDPVKLAESTIADHNLAAPDAPVLLMVSGGSDSSALAYIASSLKEYGVIGNLAMLHVNHKLRGEDSEEDARFVSGLANHLDIPLFSCEIDIAAEAARTKSNIEALARQERYIAANDTLASLCQHTGSPFADARIMCAHTADDRIENFYMRSIVGTGPGGFRGMLYRNGPVIRPLLDLTRNDLRGYLEKLAAAGAAYTGSSGELWREDATNAHTDRFRAYVRHEIIPLAKQWNAQAPLNLIRSMNLIADEDDMLDEMTASLIERDVRPLGEACYSEGFILTPTFAANPLPLMRRAVHALLKEMLGADERIDAASVEAVLCGFEGDRPVGGYVSNIQGNLAVSANKQGVRVEPMEAFRIRRKRK